MIDKQFRCEMCDAWYHDVDYFPLDPDAGYCRMFPSLVFKSRQDVCIYGRDRWEAKHGPGDITHKIPKRRQ